MHDSEIEQLRNLGFSIIPTKRRDKVAAVQWSAFQKTHASSDQIESWKTQGFANFAIVTGKISGIVVIDIDNKEAFEKVYKLGFPETVPVVMTGKGAHLYFKYPEIGKKVKNRTNFLNIQGLDVRADGGYVLAPGSIHPSGKVYKWSGEIPSVDSFPDLPEWAFDGLTRGPGRPAEKEREGDLADISTGKISEGGRNNAMFRIASSLRTRGRTHGEILERLKAENNRCDPPLGEEELETIAQSASKMPQQIGDYKLNEIGNAQRMGDIFKDDFKFSPELGKWLVWDGAKWAVDFRESVYMFRLAQQTALSIYDDAERCGDPKMKKALYRWGNTSESVAKIEATIKSARALPNVNIVGEELDADKWILNCPNGVVDLKTREFLPHDRKYLCTKMTNVEYHEYAECPRWLLFLDEITDGSWEMQCYLQRIIGYSLTGDTSEHVWFMLIGNGRNGKSTFLNAIQYLLGTYSSNIRPEALLMQGMDKVPNDLAALKGARFTCASETPASRKLNESLIKQITGGDQIQARFLYREYFDFTPQCKLVLATNYRPNISGTDVGIWRRTHEVPFPVSIPESECDPNLSSKLQEEMPGILAWAVRGCYEWQRLRLAPPDTVQRARQDYYEEMDTVGTFLQEWCEVADDPKQSDWKEPISNLYSAFVAWCSKNSEELITKKSFATKLTQKQIPSCRMPDTARARKGIRLRAYQVPNVNGRGSDWKVEPAHLQSV